MTPNELTRYLTVLIENQLQISLMIWGAPGIGKSSIVANVAGGENQGLTDTAREHTEMASYWANAREQASVVLDKMKQAGKFARSDPFGGSREWGAVRQP